jgi:hypothetical protein
MSKRSALRGIVQLPDLFQNHFMKKKVITFLFVLQLIILVKGFSQNVSINTSGAAADTSAMLDITSTAKVCLYQE